MAKSVLRLKALIMRRNGSSVRDISRALGVSKSTASLWCRDVSLTQEQVGKLRHNQIAAGHAGRLKGAHIQKQRRLMKIRTYEEDGLRVLGKLLRRDIFLLGLGLHLGEGTKVGNSVRFTNSNPSIVILFIVWVECAFKIRRSHIRYRVMINEAHRKRERVVKKQWSKLLGVPLAQFEKTTFIKAKTQKVYENYHSFLGTLALTIPKSSDLQYRILGLMRGLVYKLCDRKMPG